MCPNHISVHNHISPECWKHKTLLSCRPLFPHIHLKFSLALMHGTKLLKFCEKMSNDCGNMVSEKNISGRYSLVQKLRWKRKKHNFYSKVLNIVWKTLMAPVCPQEKIKISLVTLLESDSSLLRKCAKPHVFAETYHFFPPIDWAPWVFSVALMYETPTCTTE